MRRRRLLGIAWIGLGIIARFFGVARLVDELWKQLSIDAKTRNQLRVDIGGMLKEWTGGDRHPESGQCMVVFIDDLDRCSDTVVVQVCEAIKLYLDAPGLIFVLACDQSVLARGVSASARGGAEEGRSYLEKIVQVAYRVPPPDEPELRTLITGYAKQSRTKAIIDPTVEEILVAGTSRNPRKIKRIINSFILEYQLDPSWHEPPLSGELLVIAVLLQHLYPPFYDLIVRETIGDDPIGDFMRYARLRSELVLGVTIQDQQSETVNTIERELEQYQLGSLSSDDLGETALKRLEHKLPEEFPALAGSDALIALLRRLDDRQARVALRTRLINHPLVTETIQFEPETARRTTGAVEGLDGLRVMWIDDNPEGNAMLASELEDMGAEVKNFPNAETAIRGISRRRPDVVISDITRGVDPDAGFTGAAALRTAGYTGPILFYTARITPERRQRAEDVGALDVVTSATDVLRILSEIGAPTRS
jgi:CheY-like chemotaxis protein